MSADAQALRGTGVSPGIAIGPALVLWRDSAPVFRLEVPPDQLETEVRRLSTAVELTRCQLQSIRNRLLQELGPHAYIFDAQLLMLDDPLLIERTLTMIRDQRVNSEWALRCVAERIRELFADFADAYLKERSTDLEDVVGRLLFNLRDSPQAPTLAALPDHFILVAEDLTPSQAAELDWQRVLAIVTDAGSPTYHTAILARSLEIPGVVGLQSATEQIPPGATLVVDGLQGLLLIDPPPAEIERYHGLRDAAQAERLRQQQSPHLLPETTDRIPVRLLANAEFPDEVTGARRFGAEGIGLFRTEYLLGRAQGWPSEDTQLDLYRRLLEQMRPFPVTVRTWDLDPDSAGTSPASRPMNPALGERALRLVRRDPGPFLVQLRALLRSAVSGPLRIMFPFVSGPADLRVVLEMLDQARSDLRHAGLPCADDVPIGLNIEVPSAVVTLDLLAPSVSFVSIGTNDLIQYLLAVDRSDPSVSRFYEPLHPAVLRTIQAVVIGARRAALPVSVCGEMAADPVSALALIGLGVRELSMSAPCIPRVKNAIRAVSIGELEKSVTRCLSLPTAAEIAEQLVRLLPAEAD